MIDRNTPSDPRLRERRGDLLGRGALLFTAALLVAFAIVGWVLLVFLPGDEPGPTGSPNPSGSSASASASASPSPTPSASATASTIAPSASPGGAVVGRPFDLVIDGETVGTLTVAEPTYPQRVRGEDPPLGRRWAVVEVTYEADAGLTYDAARWRLEDDNGDVYRPADVRPQPFLGSGELDPGATVTGRVAFEIPGGADVALIQVTPEGSDPIGFRLQP